MALFSATQLLYKYATALPGKFWGIFFHFLGKNFSLISKQTWIRSCGGSNRGR